MKLINTLVFTATAALLSVASQPADAATSQSARPVLVAQDDAALRTPHAVDVPALAKGPGERGARAAAARGPQELRRYIFRTRMIHALQYADFATE